MGTMKKTDAKVRLGMLEEAKRELLTKVKEQETNLKILLTQIKAMQRLIEEAQLDIEHEAEEKVELMQEEIDKQTKVLESMLEETETAKKDAKNIFGEELNNQYEGTKSNYQINEDLLMTAASGASTNKLRELQYKNNWSQEDAKDFFAIKNSISASTQYDLNPFLKENVNETYNALKDVIKQQENQIQKNYNPELSNKIITPELFGNKNNLMKNNGPLNISTEYKPMNNNYQANKENNNLTNHKKENNHISELEKELN